MHSVQLVVATRTPRSGITLLEVIVAIGIISVLLAIIVPAVSTSRAVSQRVACGSQLRQIAIACENYTGVAGIYPPYPGGWKRHLVPYLELSDSQRIVPVYACPADREHATGELPMNVSYAMNDGQGDGYSNGICQESGNPVSPAEVIDGLSTTAAFSERLSAPWFGSLNVNWNDHRNLWSRKLRRIYVDHVDFDAFYHECHNNAGEPAAAWYLTDNYEHVMPPNHNSCQLYPTDANPIPRTVRVVTAGSPHTGGTHTVFCDGHLQFIADQIDVGVWRAVGSRNGGEVNANSAF